MFMNLTQFDKTIFTKNRQLKFLIACKKRKFSQSEDRQFSDNFAKLNCIQSIAHNWIGSGLIAYNQSYTIK